MLVLACTMIPGTPCTVGTRTIPYSTHSYTYLVQQGAGGTIYVPYGTVPYGTGYGTGNIQVPVLSVRYSYPGTRIAWYWLTGTVCCTVQYSTVRGTGTALTTFHTTVPSTRTVPLLLLQTYLRTQIQRSHSFQARTNYLWRVPADSLCAFSDFSSYWICLMFLHKHLAPKLSPSFKWQKAYFA